MINFTIIIAYFDVTIEYSILTDGKFDGNKKYIWIFCLSLSRMFNIITSKIYGTYNDIVI